MTNYKVGDKVEILGRKLNFSEPSPYFPDNVRFMDSYDDLPEPSQRIWTPVTISEIRDSGGIHIFWKDEDDWWYISRNNVESFLRPLTKVVSANMATSCVECHEHFMYPVEYNCDQGRLCWGCKSTNAWKYTNLRIV